MYIVEVVIEYQNLAVSKSFDYYSNTKIPLYTRVIVNFNNREIMGFVIAVKDYEEKEYEIKQILRLVDEKPIISEELYQLAYFLEETYLVSKIQALQTILPPGLKPSSKNKEINVKELCYEISESDQKISNRQLKLLEELKKQKANEKILRRKDLTKQYLKYDLDVLIKKGYLIKKWYDKADNLLHVHSKELLPLSSEQQLIYDEIIADKNKSYLLHGITGSGKTMIYLHLAKYYLEQEKQVLVLVPEITLTLMMQNEFAAIFGKDVAILHSSLNNTQRYQEYLKIKNNEVKIVVGTRSSIFAPLTNLGLIIIDEEHDSSYLQHTGLTYHTDQVAEFRARYNQANLLLASATPKIYSLTKAYKNQYQYLTLENRYNDYSLPKMEIVDLNQQDLNIISQKSLDTIQEYLDKGKQVIILLNRRGYNTIISCNDCHQTQLCPDCNIALTYHKASESLRCHHCHYQVPFNNTCLYCGSKNLKRLGMGTQKIEEYLMEQFKNYQILRIDQDTSENINKLEKKLKAFNDHQYQILIGTQMIAKGLNFENVDLTLVLNIDASLAFNSYDANEQAFQLLIQVAGRAGRFSGNGHVLIETWQPEHYAIQLAITNNYLGFYEKEMQMRRSYQQPPYYKMCLITLSSPKEQLVVNEAKSLYEYLNNNLNNVIIYENQPASIYRLAKVYRQQILIKYKYLNDISEQLWIVKKLFAGKKEISMVVNTDF